MKRITFGQCLNYAEWNDGKAEVVEMEIDTQKKTANELGKADLAKVYVDSGGGKASH